MRVILVLNTRVVFDLRLWQNVADEDSSDEHDSAVGASMERRSALEDAFDFGFR